MNRTIEDLLSASMREEVAGLTPAPDLVARAARRHRQRTRVRLAASATGTAGIAAAVAIAVTVASAGPGADRTGHGAGRNGPSAASAASSPRVRLVAAMITSAQLSYRLHLVNTSTLPGHRGTPAGPRRDLITYYADYTGVYNPRTSSGAGVNIMRQQSGTLGNPKFYGMVDGHMQVRIIGHHYYTRFSGKHQPWMTGPGTLVQALVLNGGRAWSPTNGASADPAVLLAAVRDLGSVKFAGKSGTGAQAVDTYDFKYHIAGDGSVKSHELNGTIVVHDRSNLIAKIIMKTRVTTAQPQLGDGGWLTFRTVMTFSDYGVPVSSVHVPPGPIEQEKNLLLGS
jgi:hypothetical protein